MQAVHLFGSGMTGVAENLRLQSEQTSDTLTSSVRDHIGLLQCLPVSTPTMMVICVLFFAIHVVFI
jgi:hypothetical protein